MLGFPSRNYPLSKLLNQDRPISLSRIQTPHWSSCHVFVNGQFNFVTFHIYRVMNDKRRRRWKKKLCRFSTNYFWRIFWMATEFICTSHHIVTRFPSSIVDVFFSSLFFSSSFILWFSSKIQSLILSSAFLSRYSQQQLLTQ